MRCRGITLVTVAVVIAVLGVLITLGGWVVRGCGARISDNLIVNPLHSSTAKIRVLTTYFGSNDRFHTYRVYAQVVEDSDSRSDWDKAPKETFEIEDSFIDGNYRTADIFGELRTYAQTDQVFELDLRGERSGVSGGGSFRQIHGATKVVFGVE